MRPFDRLLFAALALAILFAASGVIAFGIWTMEDAQDKRRCRRAGGTVVSAAGAEWRCQMPEARP